MIQKFIPRIIGMAKLQRQAKTLVRELERNDGEYVISVRENPMAVIMSVARYEALRAIEELKRREEDDVLDVVAAGDREYQNRKTIRASSLAKLR